MSEVGSQAAVGIESVEWLDAGGSHLTVRVTGRWRRRRGWVGSGARGPTTLVIERDGHRHRFPAMPEPPSLAGVAPGTWRLSFSVPSELAPGGEGRVWLSLGSTTVPLPAPDSPGPPAGAEPAAPPSAALPPAALPPAAPEHVNAPPSAPERATAPPPAQTSEPASLEIERAWRRADDAERAASELGARIDELERALADERHDRGQAAVAPVGAPPAGADPGAAAGPVTGPERDRLALEGELRALREATDVRVPSEPSVGGGLPPPAAAALPESDMVRALRRELDARVAAEAGLRARVVQSETRLAARVLLEQRTTSTLRELRAELVELHAALAGERARRTAAEDEARTARAELGIRRDRSRDAYEAIGELRGALGRLAPGPGSPAALDTDPTGGEVRATAGPVVTPERLSDALARLRETHEPAEPAEPDDAAEAPSAPSSAAETRSLPPASAAEAPSPQPSAAETPSLPPASAAAGRPTLEPALRRLAGRDVVQAGRLLVDLLGAQPTAYPHPIAYDVVLGPGYGCVQVTVGRDTSTVEVSGAARSREQVDLQLVGEPARLVRRLLAGPLRRRVPLGLARVRGRRDGLGALRALLALPLDLAGLQAAGMRADPESLLALVAAMIDPGWTREERFTIAHVDERGATVHLQIRDGRAPLVTRQAPEGRVATVLRGSAEELLASLVSGSDAQAAVPCSGDRGPLELLREWVNRAQCG